MSKDRREDAGEVYPGGNTFIPPAEDPRIGVLAAEVAELAQEVEGRAEKVADATSGNLAALDAEGNLVDSGAKPADFAPAGTVATLVGGDSGKSVRTIASEEASSAAQAIIGAGTPEAFDTLKEIADWITDDQSGAAKVVSDVSALQSGKVDKEAGKGLSTNDYTTAEKEKLAQCKTKSQLDAGWWSEWTILRDGVNVTAQVSQPEFVRPDNFWDVSCIADDYDATEPQQDDEYVDTLSWEAVDNNETFHYYTATRHRVAAPVPTKPEDIGAQPALGFTPERVANKVTELDHPTNTQYPSALLMQTELAKKQDALYIPGEMVWTFDLAYDSGEEVQEFLDEFGSALTVTEQHYGSTHTYEVGGYDTERFYVSRAVVLGDDIDPTFSLQAQNVLIGYFSGHKAASRTSIPAEVDDKPQANSGKLVLSGGVASELYAAVRNFAPDFTAKTYALNELCTYNSVLYRCKSTYTAAAQSDKPDTDTTHWEAKKASEIFLPLTGGMMTGELKGMDISAVDTAGGFLKLVGDAVGTFFLYRNGWHGASSPIYQIFLPDATGTLALLSNIGIPAFSTIATYAVGAKVIHDNAIWNCTTAVSTAGAWTGTTNWTKLFNLAADATPTEKGANLMTSGAIKTALDSIKSLKHDESGYYIEV